MKKISIICAVFLIMMLTGCEKKQYEKILGKYSNVKVEYTQPHILERYPRYEIEDSTVIMQFNGIHWWRLTVIDDETLDEIESNGKLCATSSNVDVYKVDNPDYEYAYILYPDNCEDTYLRFESISGPEHGSTGNDFTESTRYSIDGNYIYPDENYEIIESLEENGLSENEENATGSFASMSTTFQEKYKITVYTKESGHPSHDAFFETSFHWKKEGDSGACIISYTAFDDSQIEDDYEDYENLNQITIADKTYKVLTNDDTAALLYKVDDWFYIRIDLWNAVQFDENGDKTTLTFTPAYLLENGYLDDEIIMDIEEE